MNSKKNLKRNLLICLLAGSAVMYTLPLHAATSVIGNNTLPTGENSLTHNHTFDRGNLEMTIKQNGANGVIKWNSFDVGGSATVNFRGDAGGYNVLNYVNGANASQIYGTINANNNGNIFIVNPAGVQIGNSAQINVGSLYVSNQNLDTVDWSSISANTDVNTFLNKYDTHTNAELMSLGNINITNVKNGNVTFEGNGRIVIDTERIKNNDSVTENFIVRTNDANNVLLGYDAYVGTDENNDGTIDGYTGQNKTFANNVFVNNSATATAVEGYMWVEDVEQLQAINTNLSGNYALRNSIDATATSSWNDEETDTNIDTNINEGFKSIGIDEDGNIIEANVNTDNGVVTKNGFYGKFDGLDYNIFGLTINRADENNVGLFGAVDGANINNVTLVGGSITGGRAVGAIVGSARDSVISNSTNSTAVNGDYNIGGIVGDAQNSTLTNLINTGTIGVATGDGNRIGGLVGNLQESSLGGNSYNLGAVTSVGYDVGGLVGHAYDATIGDGTNLVYNRLDVTGAYNVGGIVGNMEGSSVQNAENSGTVLATGYDDGNYTFHTDYTGNGYSKGGSKTVAVNVANAGGIAGSATYVYKQNNGAHIKVGSTIKEVTNTGDVSSKQNGNDFYDAGNVGGIVGSAVDTNITNATNQENEIRGAHNVGGIAGYFGSSVGDNTDETTPHYTVTNGINDGGDIMATGARFGNDFVRETIRANFSDANNDGKYIVGNIGGVVGYMDGNNVYITQSANRGTVHTDESTDHTDVEEWQKAANVGGIVGKIDRSKTDNLKDEDGKIDVTKAAVSNSYNTGDVRGYTAVGGIAGMMYNGEIAGSYNLGAIRSTRIAVGNETPLNMGGIVGDTTENSTARAYLYDVYNKGQIGDETYTYKGRHVGGIAGRLSGTIEKAYNAGAIYNGAAVTGGIVGYLSVGSIKNVFNTGNITVENNDGENLGTQLGGLVGAANIGRGNSSISNAYNLGVIRSFNGEKTQHTLGGIIGKIVNYKSGLKEEELGGIVSVKNVYTTGDLYAQGSDVGAVYGNAADISANNISIDNVVYITKSDNTYSKADLQSAAKIDGVYGTNDDINDAWKQFITKSNEDSSNLWRVYDGTTPILNEYLPNSKKYFDENKNIDGITIIQYGTAYNPLLTIIEASKDLSFDWQKLGINNDAGLAVYGAGVTLGNFKATGGTGYYGGLIYADGNLNLNGNSNDISLGSASQIYGSSVTIKTDGKVTIYGDVTATGKAAGGESAGDITVTGGDVDVYGQLTSATKGEATNIVGIGKKYGTISDVGEITNKYDDIANAGEHYAHTTGASAVDGNITINANGTWNDADNDNIKDEGEVTGGNVNLYFGNKEQGLITTGGDLTVTGTGDVYVDSDLDIGGDMTLTSTGADSEVLLTLTNIGKVQANRFNAIIENAINGIEITGNNEQILTDAILNAVNKAGIEHTFTGTQAGHIVDALLSSVEKENSKVEALNELKEDIAVAYMHDFMHSFDKPVSGETKPGIYLNAASGDAKLTVDMWVENTNGSGQFNFEKYDTKFPGTTDNHTFKEELNKLNFTVNGTNGNAADTVYVEVSTGEQLKAIQNAGSEALGYNYALMGDINASDVEDYVAIGTGDANGFTGTFDGRGNRIIGLDTTKDSKGGNSNTLTNAGIFSTVGTNTVNNNDGTTTTYTGTVKNLNIYSGTFTGKTNAGAVAGINNGRIEGIVTFGNTVTVTGDNSNVSNAGGIVGVNNSGTFENNANDGELTGGIYDVESTGSVIAGSSDAVAGGLVGTNNGGLANSFSDSAVTVGTNVTSGTSVGLGGVVGANTEKGNVQYVDSLGVTNGGATNSSNIGGIIGTNKGNMYSGYNESIVSGKDNVGGIIGTNAEGKKVENVVNATGVEGTNNVGGLIGDNRGNVTNGRNNGTITGNTNVGGLVGNNADTNSTLTNLVNDSSAAITGIKNVGGIAGSNAGMITTGKADADDEKVNLINRGSITGYENVGGVAGTNSGTIENANNDIELNVNTDAGNDAKYFGGIAGVNTGTITNATNQANVNADGAAYVGGIVGKNDGTLENMAGNSGNVTGKNFVGGVAGLNNKDIDGVTASNDGVVKATEGGAGGIFAENTGNITNSTLINNKTVAGTGTNGATGGIIGVNSGNISRTSLKNEVDGQVIGMNNVGGLIGKNTGKVEGGRDEADSYYKYQIYNNGVINVGTWKDDNSNGKVDDGEIKGLQQGETSQNIGGLIGNNTTENGKTGSLTAGYNTGAINASGSTNVGGIAGSNSGKIDQVFNTVMVKPGSNQDIAITGGTNVGGLVGDNQANGEITNAYNTSNVVATNQDGIVGGLVGNNSGILNNAYNTTSEVKGNAASTGNLVGTNSGTVQYVYGVADKLIGDGKTAENGYVIDGSDTWLQEGTYEDFTFGANGWKIYDGSTLPMLSVFLTKVTVVDQHLVDQYFSAKHYGEFHQITADDIKALIAIGAISAPDGFGAFNNNNSLIQGVGDDAMANSGNWLYSGQIADSFVNGIFNPNNLGYDISLVYSPFELDNDPSSHWNYLFNDAPFDRNKDFRERKAEVNFVDGGMEI